MEEKAQCDACLKDVPSYEIISTEHSDESFRNYCQDCWDKAEDEAYEVSIHGNPGTDIEN